jgi:hypothetical protein
MTVSCTHYKNNAPVLRVLVASISKDEMNVEMLGLQRVRQRGAKPRKHVTDDERVQMEAE